MRQLETLFIGGGISGLAAAWQLHQMQQEVEIWEARDTLGGKITTDSEQGYTTERSASMVLNFRPEVSRFLQETGLDRHKLARTPTSKRYIVNDGALFSMPMKMAGMLFSPLWSLPGKLRLLAEPLVLQSAGENESVADFIRRRLGSEMLDRAMSAYVSGTLASDPEQADSRAVFPHLTALERRYGSLTAGAIAHKMINRKSATVTEGFSFRGGMSTLVKDLSQQLAGKIRTGHRINSIERHGRAWIVSAQTDKGERICLARRLVLCTPASVSASLIRPSHAELADLLDGIDYASVSVVHLGYRRSQVEHCMQGTGFLTPWKESLSMNGSMWMHSLFGDRAPQGHLLTSNYLGGARCPQVSGWSRQYKIDAVHRELAGLAGITGDPHWARVDHHRCALPLYHGHYSVRLEAIAAAQDTLPGLHLHANYIGGVSIRDRIMASQKLATALCAPPVAGTAGMEQLAPRNCCA